MLPGSKMALVPRSPEKQKAAKRWAVLKGHRLHLYVDAADNEPQLVLELASCEVIVSEGAFFTDVSLSCCDVAKASPCAADILCVPDRPGIALNAAAPSQGGSCGV